MRRILSLAIIGVLLTARAWAGTIIFNVSDGNFNDGTKWIGGVAPGSTDIAVWNATSGNCTLNADFTVGGINATDYVNTWTQNANVDARSNGDVVLGSGMTWTIADTSRTLKLAGSVNLTTNGIPTPVIQVLGSTVVTLQDNLTFFADKQAYLQLQSGGTVNLNGKVISGNNVTNRVLIYSNTLGTPRFINTTTAGSNFSNADFRDIDVTTAVNLSAIPGGSGDCGGNANITFTPAKPQFWNSTTGGYWSNATKWYNASDLGPGRMPLPQDDAYINATFSGSQTIIADMPRLCRSIDTTGAGGNLTLALNITSNTFYGSLDLSGVDILSLGNYQRDFEGRGSFILEPNGLSFFEGSIKIQMVGGSLTLTSDFRKTSLSNGRQFHISHGTFDANDFNLYISGGFTTDYASSHTLYMRNGTWAFSQGFDYTYTNFRGSGLTFDAGASTIIVETTNKDGRFYGGNRTFYNFIINSSSYQMNISDTNTFNNFTINAPITVKFEDGKTTTVSAFYANGTESSPITLTGTGTGGWYINDTSGTNSVTYCNISYSNAGGGASWLAYTTNGNIDGGNNTGWVFTGEPPVVTTGIMTTRSSYWGDLAITLGIVTHGMLRLLGGVL